MVKMAEFEVMDPYVRMMRIKKAVSLSGIWRDIDNVFTYIAAGDAEFIMNGNRYRLHAGNVILIPAYLAHRITSTGSQQLVQYIIHFDFIETEESRKRIHRDIMDDADMQADGIVHRTSEVGESIPGEQIIIAEIPETERNRLIRLYLKMHREFEQHLPGRDLLLKAVCTEILVLTLRNSIELAELGQKVGRQTKAWIHVENAVDYIMRTDLREGLDNESIASAIGVTPNYLTRVFQEQLGISLHKYILNRRVERAQQLLLSNKRNVTEVASMTGFSSIHVFSKSFKNVLGVSPSQFLDEIVNREFIAETMTDVSEQLG